MSCVNYRLRVGRDSIEPTGDVWYAAWILDTQTGVETLIGRILVPESWGQLSALSTEWTLRIDYTPPTSCAEAEPSSGLYGWPTADGGTVQPFMHRNRFDEPARCATSRITDLSSGVRHELGI
jgi:hypothetical protein